MIWFTWRQFRTRAAIAAGALAVLGVALIIGAQSIADAYAAANLDACGSDCDAAVSSFLRQVKTGTSGAVYNLALALMYLVPALIGAFWGAPLVARELETGTHQLAWNQSVTRTRWLATKLAILGTATLATVGLLSWAVTTWAHRIDARTGDRITPLLYGARGVVPIGYALFAFVLGVTVGMLIRRAVPAMAATLAIYAAVVGAMAMWIRAHLVPPTHTTLPLDLENLDEFMINGGDGAMQIFGKGPADAWVLANQTRTPAGELFTGAGKPVACGGPNSPGNDLRACREWVGSLGLQQDLSYHPAGHFWTLQWVETGIFVALAALLAGFCFWWLRRRLT